MPALLGAFERGGSFSYVVEDAGGPLGSGRGTPAAPAVPSAAFDAFARRDPLALARALLECFEAFAEAGGFLLSDFRPEQFSLSPTTGAVAIVDAPLANGGPYAAWARRRYPAWCFPRPEDCRPRCPRTKKFHACAPLSKCEPSSRGAPEAAGLCLRRTVCARVSARTHVFDLFNRPWLVPRIAALARDSDAAAASLLGALGANASAPDPRDRPSLAALLAALPRNRGLRTVD